MTESGPFQGVSALRSWVASNGVVRAGLPANFMAELLASLSIFSVLANNLSESLSRIDAQWRTLGGDNMLKASLGQLLVLLGDTVAETRHATQQAMNVKVAGNKVFGRIEQEIAIHTKEIRQMTAAIRTSEKRMEAAAKAAREATEKLNAGDYILHGLEAIFTVGLVDKNRENINKLNTSIAVHKGEAASRRQHREMLATYKAELVALRNGIERVLTVDQAITQFQNDLVALGPLLLPAYQHIEKSETTSNLKVANIRLEQARPKMNAMSKWIQALNIK